MSHSNLTAEGKRADIVNAACLYPLLSLLIYGTCCAYRTILSVASAAAVDVERDDESASRGASLPEAVKVSITKLHAALLDALTKSLLVSVDDAVETRVIALNASTGNVITAVWLKRSPGSVGEPSKVESHALQSGSQPDPSLPWFENAGGSTGLRFAGTSDCSHNRRSA